MNEVMEVKMRCIEAASKNPPVHVNGQAAGILECAAMWANWILTEPEKKPGIEALI